MKLRKYDYGLIIDFGNSASILIAKQSSEMINIDNYTFVIDTNKVLALDNDNSRYVFNPGEYERDNIFIDATKIGNTNIYYIFEGLKKHKILLIDSFNTDVVNNIDEIDDLADIMIINVDNLEPSDVLRVTEKVSDLQFSLAILFSYVQEVDLLSDNLRNKLNLEKYDLKTDLYFLAEDAMNQEKTIFLSI
ncbi:MAG: hypothetical protein N3A71_03965 [Candidatus Dojkabacteria bacterium]|nr:hypothetical protein [Candidatus Dojkabacteria bacterium]